MANKITNALIVVLVVVAIGSFVYSMIRPPSANDAAVQLIPIADTYQTSPAKQPVVIKLDTSAPADANQNKWTLTRKATPTAQGTPQAGSQTANSGPSAASRPATAGYYNPTQAQTGSSAANGYYDPTATSPQSPESSTSSPPATSATNASSGAAASSPNELYNSSTSVPGSTH
jgi:hypothetical protein